MYLNYFQLREEPFGSTPDPRFLYQSETHREALATLYYGYHSNRGFTALIAQPGMGKTTLLFQFLQNIRKSARTVFLFQTQCNTRELFRYLLYDLGIKPGEDVAEMHQQLNAVLVEEARAGRRVVLVIDEAQNLPDSVLETVRLLSDFETSRAKLMQIVLAGQPQLSEKLASPALEQLRQRISLLCRLDRFTPVETANYICHRLEVAGHSGPMPFTTGAIIRIAEYSEGNPRRINTLCFNALSLCCAVKRKQVDRAVVEEVIADQDLSSLMPISVGEYGKTDAKAVAQQQRAGAERVRIRWPRVRRIMMTAAVLVFGFMCLSGIGPKWQPEVAAATTSATTSASVVNRTLVAALSQQAQSAAVPAVAASQPVRTRTATESVVVTVAPHQTLREISMQHLGRFDAAQLKQIRGLNPGLEDPNHVQAGQLIRLPQDSRSSQATTQLNVQADRN
jgi:general secretion pathway protein A